MTSTHTPGQWQIAKGNKLNPADAGRLYIVIQDRGLFVEIARMQEALPPVTIEANAAFIVRACNSHDQIVAALKVAEQLALIASDWNMDEVEINGSMTSIETVKDIFTAAIHQATSA